MAKRVFLKRSSVPGKLPDSKDDVSYGELLVNYAAGNEFIGLKNSDNEYARINAHPDAADVSFNAESHADSGFTGTTAEESIAQIETEILNNEKVVSASLNDINTKLSAIPEATVTGVTGDILSLSDKIVNATVALDYGDATTESLNGKKAIKLIGKDNKVLSEIDASEFIKDGMVKEVKFDSKTHILTLTFNTDGGGTSVTADLSELVDTYKAGDGLELGTDGTFSVKSEIARIGTTTGETPDTKESNTVEGAKRYADDIKTTIDGYTVNGKAISGNPVLKAADIEVESHSDSGFTGTTVQESISQIETEMLKNENTLSASLNDVNTKLSGKVDSVDGKGLSTNDYTTEEKTKLAGIADGAEVNVITGITVNSETVSPDGKVIALTIPTEEQLGDKNVIETVKLNGTALVATDKAVDILPTASGTTFDKSVHVNSGFTGENVQDAITGIEQAIIDNELVVSNSLNDLNGKVSVKVDKVDGKQLSTEDYTTEEKTKLAGLTPDLYCIKRTVEKVLPDYASMGTDTGSTSQTVALDAGKFYIIGRTGALTITLPDAAADDCLEYCCQFYVPSSGFTLTMPSSVYWQNGAVPTFEENTCCQMVVVNNCATIGAYKAS